MNTANVNNNLANALGIENQIVTSNTQFLPPLVLESSVNLNLTPDAEEDYRLARRTFKDLIRKGNDALDGILEVAKSSDKPSAYEVVSTLIKNVSDVTKDLYDLQKKTKELKGEDKLKEPQVNIDKAIFTGTTAELLRNLKTNGDQ